MSFESQDIDTGDDERKRDSSRKRDGKREKREKGYQMFEAEESDEEPLALAEDLKSPSKQKKERAKPTFKFPVSVRKEKTKEKEDKKDKEAKLEEKEKKKEEKEKKKHKKDKKKSKHGHKDTSPAMAAPTVTENPIFGVPLAVAVDRNKSHDGIELPALVRECIDYIEEYGLACEGIYRLSGVKSKVQHLKECYNRGEPIHLLEHEPNVVASLLKLFLRELPEPVLTTQLMPKFEEASTIKINKKKIEAFTRVIADLPTCNRLLLSWMIVHMTHVIELAKENKMSLQNVSIVLSPTMQISHRVLNVLFSNATELFGDVSIRRYVPPLKPAHSKWSLELPDNLAALEEELAKQESLLNQLHAELHSGREDPDTSEQLWEVQRVVTQLKRKIKMGKKNVELVERRRTNMDAKRSSNTSLPSLSAPEELHLDLRPAPSAVTTVTTTAQVEGAGMVGDGGPEQEKQTEATAEDGEAQAKQETEAGEEKVVVVAETKGDGEAVEASSDGSSARKDAGDEDKAKRMSDPKAKRLSDPKKGVKFAEEPQPEGKEPTKEEEEAAADKAEKAEAAAEGDGSEAKSEKDAKAKHDGAEAKESAVVKDTSEAETTHDRGDAEPGGAGEAEDAGTPAEIVTRQTPPRDSGEGQSRNSVECKESEGVKTLEKGGSSSPRGKYAREDSVTVEEGPQVVEGPPTPSSSTPAPTKPASATEPTESDGTPSADKKEAKKSVKFAPEDEQEKTSQPSEKTEGGEAGKESWSTSSPSSSSSSSSGEKAPEKEAAPVPQEKPKKPRAYEYRKAPNPPFVSTSLLKPMKAELPRPRPAEKKEAEEESPQQDTERWRELEEELLGQGKDEEEEAEIERLLEEEYYLQLEREELLAIEDELRQKLDTERSEMERLSQEIQELQYLRQDSDLEDISSSSSSSEDSEDEEDLQDLLTQLIQENQELETNSADLCQKIHEERMICLSVKLQIRMLQQKQLESSYS